jgi:hypothetical protein
MSFAIDPTYRHPNCDIKAWPPSSAITTFYIAAQHAGIAVIVYSSPMSAIRR